MSKRLQLLVEDQEYARIQSSAELEGMTVADWVRGAVMRATRERAERASDRKIQAVRAAAVHAFPAPAIDQMLAEVDDDRGRDLG